MNARTGRPGLLAELLLLPVIVVFFSSADIHYFQAGVLPIPSVYAFLLALGCVAAWVLLRCMLWDRFAARTVALYAAHVPVLLALGSIVFVAFLLSFLPGTYWGDGPRYVMYPVYDAIAVVLTMLLPLVVTPEAFRRQLACAFVVFAGSVLIDAASPGTFSILAERAAGFAGNPNSAAFLLIAFCCLLVRFDGARPGEIAVITLTAAGVLTTLSRGGLVLLAFVLVCYAYGALGRPRDRARGGRWRGVLAIGLIVVAIAGATAGLVQRAEIFTLQNQSRMDMFAGEQQFVTKEDSRYALLMEAVELVGEAPLLGHGTGFTWSLPEGPHNIYLTQWTNNGIPGVATFLWLLIAATALFRRRLSRPGLVFMGVVAMEGFFSHNLLEDRAFLAFLGVQLTLSYEAAQRRRAEAAREAHARFTAGARGGGAARSAPRIRARIVGQG